MDPGMPTGSAPGDDEQRDWGDALISQGKPKMAAKLDERLGADSVTQPSGENNLTNTLISDFLPPKL